MTDETYINVDIDMLSIQDPRPSGDRHLADTTASEALHTKTSRIQQEVPKTCHETWICLFISVGFTARCILQLGLNICLRLHYVSSTEVDKLKADISNLTSVRSAQIDQLETELKYLTRMKSAEIDQLKAE